MTIRQNIEFGLKEQKMPQKEVNYKVDKVLELVSLTEFASRYPNQLSGGQQQRVALARTVVTEPKVLLLDEPLSNLDASLRVEMRQELLSLQRELNLTTIFVTHDQEEANTTSDRIALLKAGIVQQIDTPNNLYDTPKNLFVANFIGSANILKGNVVKENGECIFITSDNFKIPVKTDILGKCSILLRPHTLVVSTKEDCHLEGKVINKEFLGNMVRYFVKVLNNELIIDSIHFKSSVLLDIGKLIYIKTNENENYILKNE